MNRYRQVFAGYAALTTALIVYGCDSKAPGADIVARPTAQASLPPATPPKIESPAAPKPDLDRGKLPANMQTDAYHYFSLSYGKPLDMEMTTKPDNGVLTGSMATRMTQVDNARATFIVETTGALNDRVGNERVVLKPDGVYAVSSDKEKLTQPQLELPTGFISGKAWFVDSTVVAPAGKVRQQIKYSCTGTQTIKIGATTYSAMCVVGVGKFSGAVSAHVVTREWLVKDIGTVKMEMVQTSKGKPPVTFDMIWKPTDSKAKS